MSNQRLALIIIGDYAGSLHSPQTRPYPIDMRLAAELVDVLADPDRGAFDVTVLSDAASWEIGQHLDDLLIDRDSSDVVLIYYIGRGVVSAGGAPYLATTDTRPGHLMATAVDIGWITTLMHGSQAGSVALILDCRFTRPQGADGDAELGDPLECEVPAGGPHRVVLTVDTHLPPTDPADRTGDPDTPPSSAFTVALIDGIRTGAADRDGDGVITLDDLYDHIQDHLRTHAPQLTAHKREQGRPRRLVIVDAHPQATKPPPPDGPVTSRPIPPGAPISPPGDPASGRARRRPLIIAGAAVAAAAIVTMAITQQIANRPAIQVRVAVAGALASSGDKAGVARLLAAQQDQAPEVRQTATDGLTTLLDSLPAPDAVAALTAAQQDQAPEVRQTAAQRLTTLLNSLPPPDAVAALTAALDDDRVSVRDSVRTTFATYTAADVNRAPVTVAQLLQTQAAADSASRVRDAAARALTTSLDGLPVTVAIPSLAAAFADPTIAAVATTTLQQYVTTITQAGDVKATQAIVPLMQVQADPASAQAARDAATQSLTALLAGIPDDRAVAGLTAALRATSVAAAADAALHQYLTGIGPDRAAAAVVAAEAGDAWLAVALGVPPEQLATETRRRGIELDPAAVITAAVAPARSGQPIPAAHAYQPSDGYHPAAVLSSAASPFGAPAARWAPTAVRFLEIVVVVDEVNRTGEHIETCDYEPINPAVPLTVTRYRATQTVRVIAAADGHTIAEQTLTGPDAAPCQDIETFNSLQRNIDRVGDPPDLTSAIPWLESIIHPPA